MGNNEFKMVVAVILDWWFGHISVSNEDILVKFALWIDFVHTAVSRHAK